MRLLKSLRMPYKHVKLTKYASERMKLRNIMFSEVKKTLTEPDYIYKGYYV